MGRFVGTRRALFTLLNGLFLNGSRLTSATSFASPVALSAGANTLSVKPPNTTATYTLAGAVSGSGPLAVDANVRLDAAATYTGATTITVGRTLTLANNYATSGFTVPVGATLVFAPTIANQVGSSNASLTGAGTVTKSGVNQWNPCGGSRTFNFSMTGGLIDVQGGKITGSSGFNANWTANLSSLNVASGAIFSGVEGGIRVDALTGAGSVTLGYTNTGGLTLGVNNTAAGPYNPTAGTATFSGAISPEGGVTTGSFLTKIGTGTQILLGTNTYKGTTTVSAGRLEFGNATIAASLGTGALTVAAGATLAIWNYNVAQSPLAIANTLTGAGALTLNGPGGNNGSFTMSGTSGFTGSLTLNGARFNTNAGFGSGTNPITINSGSNIYLYGGTLSNPLSIAGTGGDAWGAVRMDTGSLSGAVTLLANARIGQQAASSVNISGTITGAFTLTLAPATGGTFNLSGNSSAITAINATAGDLAITGSSTAISVSGGAAVGGGSATSGGVKALTFNASNSILRVRPLSTTSLARLTATSLVNASGFTVAFSGGFTVTAGSYNILSITSTAAPTLGTITSSGLANIGRTGATYAITGSAGAWNLTVTLT